MTKIDSKIIKEMTKAHYKLQTGSYLQGVFDLNGAVFSLGKFITDCYWNYASLVSVDVSEIAGLISRVIDFSVKNNRTPAFYLDPTTQPSEFNKHLEQGGFTLKDEEVWMLYNTSTKISPDFSELINIELVDSLEKVKVFTDIFDKGFEMGSTAYSTSLIFAFNNPNDVEILHYMATIDGVPCGVASLYSFENFGAIYNVTVLPSFRKKGIGTALNKQAILDSVSRKHELLFLQTGEGGDAYRIYSKLGFESIFSASIYLKE